MTAFINPNLTQQQRDNLATLADVLASPERRAALAPNVGFNMSWFTSTETFAVIKDDERNYECGTVACAAGWGPIAGIGTAPDDETWSDYCAEHFGAGLGYATRNLGDAELRIADDLFNYMFGAGWRWSDNSPEGAAKRIRTVLSDGIPKDWQKQEPYQSDTANYEYSPLAPASMLDRLAPTTTQGE